MRLYLLPISTRRTLIYCKRLNNVTSEQTTYLDKATHKAAALWAGWEKKESGWQKKVVDYGNKALMRISFEEWGLKSVPPLSARREEEELSGKEVVEVSYPQAMIPSEKILPLLRRLGTERQALHKQRMIYSIIGMPISAPFAIVPIVPNLPFFYLVYRAWSHWRAWSGSKHIEFLLDKNLLKKAPSSILDQLYTSGLRDAKASNTVIATPAISSSPSDASEDSPAESMVLQQRNGKLIAEALAIPELEIEIERAIWQVENDLKSKKEKSEEKSALDKKAGEAGTAKGEEAETKAKPDAEAGKAGKKD